MSRAPAEIIARKRDGAALSREEIRTLIDGVVAGAVAGAGGEGSLGDGPLGAFLMAVYCRGMNREETVDLTLAMRDSGRVLDLSAVDGLKIDKHSTGGVGDKTSLVLAPLVAAAGVPVPMISGRGLEHTGGTLDKLESIPGYRVDLGPEEFLSVLDGTGFVIAGAGPDLAPADRRLYALRDVTGTVASVPLIVGSILSKKLAAGVDGLVMDVKVGRGTFMKDVDAARELADALVEVGTGAGLRVRAHLTSMDVPLGRAVGNALEVREAIEALRGEGPDDLMEVVMALGAEMLVLGGVADDGTDARTRLDEALSSGAALDRFRRNVERQGGDPRVVDDPAGRLPAAPVVREVGAEVGGFVTDVDALAIGRAVAALGGGRREVGDEVDPRVGVRLRRTVGEPVGEGEPVAEIHAADAEAATRAARVVSAAVSIGAAAPPRAVSRIM